MYETLDAARRQAQERANRTGKAVDIRRRLDNSSFVVCKGGEKVNPKISKFLETVSPRREK